jgi:predicted permease
VRFAPGVRHALQWLLHRDRAERDLDDEMRFAVDELTARHRTRGLTDADARREALLELGGVDQVKEQVRDMRVGVGLEMAFRDARFALRGLARDRAFSVAAILTLALGIGGTAAIFSVVSALLLQPLPYRLSDRLVFVWQDLTDAGYPRAPLAGPELADLRERGTLFDGFGAIWGSSTTLTGDGDPEQLRIGRVTPDFFNVLGVQAAVGRTFSATDFEETSPQTIVLSWPLFQRRFGGNSAIVGQRVVVDGTPATVLGVMPDAFRLLLPPEANVPETLDAFLLLNRGFEQGPRTQQFLRVVARIKQGVDLAAAQAEVADIGRRVGREFADYGPSGAVFYAVGLQDDALRDVRPALVALFGGVAILLLIACVNVASLLVTRAASRRHETALRLALGATRSRLTRQCAVDGLVLAALGGIAGLVVARAGLALLLALRPATLTRLDVARIDLNVLALTAVIALSWGLLFSLAPLSEMLRGHITTGLQPRGPSAAGSPVGYRTRAALVVLQVALSVVLLIGATLLLRAFTELQRSDIGFRSEQVLSFKVPYFSPNTPSPEAADAFSMTLRRSLASLPGVTGVGGISHVPYDQVPNWGGPYLLEGQTDAASARIADTRAVTPGFFEAAGATLIEGRYFTDDDRLGSRRVAIVDQRLAERTWPGRSAIGRRLRADPWTSGEPNEWVTVIGVVKHLRHRRATAELNEQIYFPIAQAPRNPIAYVVRADTDPVALAAAVRDVVRKAGPHLPVFDVRPLGDYVSESRATQRFTIVLAAGFAIVALVLACVGVYGVTAYSVALRRQEFGVRLALGARASQLLSLVVSEGGRLAAAGLSLGLVGGLAAAVLLQHQLLGVKPWDPVSYLAAVAVLLASTLTASWVPARRATRVSPIESLRSE